MDNFFARVEGRAHAWPPGRRDLHWLVIPGEAFARLRLYEPYCRFAFRVAPSHLLWPLSGPKDSSVRPTPH